MLSNNFISQQLINFISMAVIFDFDFFFVTQACFAIVIMSIYVKC